MAVTEHRKNRVAIMRVPLQWILAAGVVGTVLAGVSTSRAQQTIRVGWTIPAEESKYWMMRRPAEFPDLGKTYNIEWTQFQGTAPMTQALAAGALAGIPKSAALPVLVTAVRRAAQGLEVMHPARRRQLIEAHTRVHDRGLVLGRRLEKLSGRERAVLDRLARGRRAQSIAEEFVVSVSTVRTQIRAILNKLEVGSQLEAVSLLNDQGAANRPHSADNVV